MSSEAPLEEHARWLFTPFTGQVRDPIYGYIDFVKSSEGAVIDSWALQRLRYIYQLQAAHFVYPGATHTRFSHALGVMHLSYKYITHLLRSVVVGEGLELKHYREAVFAARLLGLLHDIGHGPFSHAFDKHVYANKSFLGYRVGNHEVVGYLIYRNALRDLIKKAFSEEKASLGVDVEVLLDLLDAGMKPPRGMKRFTELSSKGLLSGSDFFEPERSSDLGTITRMVVRDYVYTSDIMDYLKRDSYFTGVPIGEINDDWIIRNSYVLKRGGRPAIAVASKVLDEIARMFDARKLMYKYVYLHPVNVAFIETIGSLLHCVKSYITSILERVLEQPEGAAEYLKLTDHSIYSKLQELLFASLSEYECEDKQQAKKALESVFYKRKPPWKQVVRLTYDLREARAISSEIVQEVVKRKIKEEVASELAHKGVSVSDVEVVVDKIDVYPSAGAEIASTIEVVDVKDGRVVYTESINLGEFAEKTGLKPEALVTIYVSRDVYKNLSNADLSKAITISKGVISSVVYGKREEAPETS